MSKYLLVVDMQKDFIDGALGTPEAVAIVPKVIDKIKNYTGTVVYTRDTHDEDYLDTQEGKKLPVIHCVRDTEGWQLQKDIEALMTERKSLVFDKPIFGSIQMAGCLSGINKLAPIEEIEIVGLCTDICVISNALLLKAAMPETPIRVDASCCTGVTPESHHHALEAMRMCQIEIS